ncbi:MAG: cell division ATP-binding protein FtsE [Alphaproteobacteria bacterium]
MISFENVGMRYGTGPEVLRDVTLDLPAGSFHFLTGASGAGKSSLMRLMYLAGRPSRGRISIFGRDLEEIPRVELPELRRDIGVVFQDFRLLDHLTTYENVALPLKVKGASDGVIRKHVSELLAWVGLNGQANARPATLSGGQQQRAAIARAVVTGPRLLLADEPTGNVDDAYAQRLLFLFKELHRQGTTVVIATHNRSLIEANSFPVLHLEDGILSHVETDLVYDG